MRRPVLIFDFGNVVAFFDYDRVFAAFGKTLGQTAPELSARLHDLGFPALLERYESGKLTSGEFSKTLSELAGFDGLTHDDFTAAWTNLFWLNEPVAELVAALRAEGYTLLLGSNTNDLHATQFKHQFAPTLAHFDHLVLSHEVGHVKPAAEFYLACARHAGAEPADCVFIDDRPENVEGARRAGLTAIHFTDAPALVDALKRIGVEV